MWGYYKSALNLAARELLGKRLCAEKPWISQATLAIIDQRRQAIQRGDVEEYRRQAVAGPRRRSLRHDKQQRMEQVTSMDENHLLRGEIKDAFASFRQLKQKCATSSAPLKALDGKLLSDGICCCKVAGALQHFTKSAYRVSPGRSGIWSTSIHARFHHPTLPPTIIEVYKAMTRWRQARHQEYEVSIQSTSNTVEVMPYTHCTKYSLGSGKWFLRNGTRAS